MHEQIPLMIICLVSQFWPNNVIKFSYLQRNLLHFCRFCLRTETCAHPHSHSVCILVQQKREVRQCSWRKFIITVVDWVYLRPLCCFVCASTLALHFVVPAVTSHLRDIRQTWSVYLFHYPDRSFLIVRKQLHTFTKLTLELLCFVCVFFYNLLLHLTVCFSISFSSISVNLFFTKLFLLTHSHSLALPVCPFLWEAL